MQGTMKMIIIIYLDISTSTVCWSFNAKPVPLKLSSTSDYSVTSMVYVCGKFIKKDGRSGAAEIRNKVLAPLGWHGRVGGGGKVAPLCIHFR